MTVRNLIRLPVTNVRFSYYTEGEREKQRSDLHISMFTDEGLAEYKDILDLEAVATNDAEDVLYVKSNEDDDAEKWVERIYEFWLLLTHYGAYRWNPEDYGDTPCVDRDELYEIHKQYFTFTDEITK